MFKFDEYPKIKECHEEYVRLSELASKASFKCDRCELSKEEEYMKNYLETERRLEEYSQNIYAKVVFNVFNSVEPTLRYVWKNNLYKSWSEIFGKDFDTCTESQRIKLVCLVEEEDPYILPAEYYTAPNETLKYREQQGYMD